MTVHWPSGGPHKRHKSFAVRGHRVNLRDDHPALVKGQSLFQARVEDQSERPRLLISGENSRKIGKRVTKGPYRGFPIFTLTLEERATCPSTCLEWRTCYGNSMNWARRIKHGREFEERLWDELADKQAAHPSGFLVRLHVLGDFYSVDYAQLWHEALEAYPALHVFGYTARPPQSEIGQLICEMIAVWPTRFCLRFSGWNGPRNGAVVVEQGEPTPHIICPAQTGKTQCCATCGFCWHSDKTIAFLRH